MLDQVWSYFVSGNNEVLVFTFFCGLCVFPLWLIWKSTYVVDRPYNQYATSFGTQTNNEASTSSTSVSANQHFQTTTNNLAASLDAESSDNDHSSFVETSNSQQSSVNTNISRESLYTGSDSATNADVRNNNPEEASVSEGSEDFTSNSTTPLPGHFFIRIKFLDDTVKVVQVKHTDTIQEFRRKSFPAALASRYRIIYCGRVLENNLTLQQCGINPQGTSASSDNLPVVHCFLSSLPASATTSNSASNQLHNSIEELNIGHFFLPLLGSILSFLWYLCIYHTTLFTIPSIIGVIGLSCFFLVLIINRFA